MTESAQWGRFSENALLLDQMVSKNQGLLPCQVQTQNWYTDFGFENPESVIDLINPYNKVQLHNPLHPFENPYLFQPHIKLT